MLGVAKGLFEGFAMAAVVWSNPTAATDPQDVAGVQLGMPVSEAIAFMGGSVQTVQMEVSANSLGNEMIWDERGVMLLSCKGRVTSVAVNTNGGFHELAAVLKHDIAERGPVSLVVDNAEAGADTLSSLSAKWQESKNYTYVVTYTTMAHGPSTISRAVNVNETCRL